jgi:hypothetical protein
LSTLLFFFIPAEKSSKSFQTSDMTSKNDVLTYILAYFCQRSGRGTTLLTPTFPLSFTAVTDYLKAGEVLPGCGRDTSQNSNQFHAPGHV